MNHWRLDSRGRGLSALLILIVIITVARAQDDAVKSLSDEYARLEREGLKENFHRELSFTILQEYLPPGTRMTSGYRSPQKQLDLIFRLARANNIPANANATVGDEKSWSPTLMALRQKGFIIAAPTTTPHGTDEAVFDMSGADLNAIREGCLRAEKVGMIKFKRILFETQNNAVHVEIDSISPKALNILGKRKSNSPGAPSGGGSDAPPSEADQRGRMLQQLQVLHDGEPDPAKKIDYDRSKRNLLDPAADAAAIKSLDEEIAQHQREEQQLAGAGKKREFVIKISAALRERRYEDAESEAEDFATAFPGEQESQNMLIRIKTQRLVSEARDALEAAGCDDCEKAAKLTDQALELSPNHQGAMLLKEEADDCLKSCTVKRVSFVVLGLVVLLVFVGSLLGWYLMSRPGSWLSGKIKGPPQWVLVGIGGAGQGQTFPLDKPEIAIGSQGRPHGPADIEICDAERKISRRHCSIMQNGKQFYVIDESTNGTKVNDREITKGALTEIHQGDRISLADEAVLMLKQG